MTHSVDPEDRELHRLFDAARRADAAEAPEFRNPYREPARSRPPAFRPAMLLAFAAGGATVLAVVLAAPYFLELHPMESVEIARLPSVERPETSAVAPEVEQDLRELKDKLAALSYLAKKEAVAGEQAVAESVTEHPNAVEAVEAVEAAGTVAVIAAAQPPPPPAKNLPVPRSSAPSATPSEPVVGQSYTNVIVMVPGVQDKAGNRLSVHAAPSRDLSATIGGVRDIDPLTGQRLTDVNPNSIEEMEVISGGADVEFGRAAGGFVARESTFQTEGYRAFQENTFRSVEDHPLSTFSIDVDTASYTNVRRFLNDWRMPPIDAVRIEEIINYFRYDYPPSRGREPFSTDIEIADCPWNPAHRLARIGIQARVIDRRELAGTNLVFLIDVSGSMQDPAKLPLLKQALRILTGQLGASDTVAMVVYAGSSGLVLPPTAGTDHGEILAAIDTLEAGGSTNGGAGIDLAYRTALDSFVRGGVNRVILATDGDFNVGVTGASELIDRIRRAAGAGVFLSVLGFGTGNYKDDRLEQLADEGNGNYAYIDSINEARRVLVEQLGGTLVTIAKDVKLQVEFNPDVVAAYRLIGYENRTLSKEDFNDDRKDAGEIGSGHSVTVLYELVPAGAADGFTPSVDPLRYQTQPSPRAAARYGESFTLKIRYKEPEGEASRLLQFPVTDTGLGLAAASDDFRLASAAALFGMLLRGSDQAAGANWGLVRSLLEDCRGGDMDGRRLEFLSLVLHAEQLRPAP